MSDDIKCFHCGQSLLPLLRRSDVNGSGTIAPRPLHITEREYLRAPKRYFDEAKARPVVVTSNDGRSRVTLTRPQSPLPEE